MVAYTLFFVWVLSAVGTQPVVARAAPIIANVQDSTRALYGALDQRQRTLLHWALAFAAYAPLTLVHFVGVTLLMPFLCAVLLIAGAVTCSKTRSAALGALQSVAPSLVPKIADAVKKLDRAAFLSNFSIASLTQMSAQEHEMIEGNSDDEKSSDETENENVDAKQDLATQDEMIMYD